MSTSYDGTILDHLAEHMLYLSTASSFWFSLDSSYDHEFHLSKRFGMIPHDYECIFTIKLTLLNAFLNGRLKLQLTGWTIMPCQLVVVSSLADLSCWN